MHFFFPHTQLTDISQHQALVWFSAIETHKVSRCHDVSCRLSIYARSGSIQCSSAFVFYHLQVVLWEDSPCQSRGDTQQTEEGWGFPYQRE